MARAGNLLYAVYADSGTGETSLFKSSDGEGNSWSRRGLVVEGVERDFSSWRPFRISVDEETGTAGVFGIFSVGHGLLCRSFDEGDTWEKFEAPDNEGYNTYDFAFKPGDPSTIMIMVAYGGSETCNNCLDANPVWNGKVAIPFSGGGYPNTVVWPYPKRTYCWCTGLPNDGVRVSRDEGVSWSSLRSTTNINGARIQYIAFHPVQGNAPIIISQDGKMYIGLLTLGEWNGLVAGEGTVNDGNATNYAPAGLSVLQAAFCGDRVVLVGDVASDEHTIARTSVGTSTDLITLGAHGYENGQRLRYRRHGWVVLASNVNVNGTITQSAHGMSNGDTVMYDPNGYTAIPELTPGVDYYVVNKATNTYQLAATPGGAAITFSGTGNNLQIFKGPPIGGLVDGQDYFVRDKTVNNFKLAEVEGGDAIDFTYAGNNVQTIGIPKAGLAYCSSESYANGTPSFTFPPIDSGICFHSVVADPKNMDYVWACATGTVPLPASGGVWRSTDNGSSWAQANAGAPYPYTGSSVWPANETLAVYGTAVDPTQDPLAEADTLLMAFDIKEGAWHFWDGIPVKSLCYNPQTRKVEGAGFGGVVDLDARGDSVDITLALALSGFTDPDKLKRVRHLELDLTADACDLTCEFMVDGGYHFGLTKALGVKGWWTMETDPDPADQPEAPAALFATRGVFRPALRQVLRFPCPIGGRGKLARAIISGTVSGEFRIHRVVLNFGEV